MKPAWLVRLSPSWRARMVRFGFNFHPELERTYTVELKDQHGTVHTVVERTVYIAEKNHYRTKSGGDKNGKNMAE